MSESEIRCLTSHATFQLYMLRHSYICADGLKKFDLRSGSKRNIHFVGFFNVPVQAPTRGQPFYGYSEKPFHFSRLLRHALGQGGHILHLTPGSPREVNVEEYTCIVHKKTWTRYQSIIQCDREKRNLNLSHRSS